MNALIVINEKAGGFSAKTLQQSILEELQNYPSAERDHVSVLISSQPGDVVDKLAQCQAALDRVIAVGGDGTITETIAAMMPYPHLMLGIVPAGTGNRLADNLGIPNSIKLALQTALRGTPQKIDLGVINGRYFSLMAGAGLDAEIMDKVRPIEKKSMGIFAYFWQGVQRAFGVPYAVYEIEVDGQRLRTRGIGVVVANAGNLLGRYFTLTPGAQTDDGLLDVCILASKNRIDYWTTLIQLLLQQRRDITEPGVKHMRGAQITIRSRPAVKAQADGDVIGTTPLFIQALPNAVTVLVPPANQMGNPLVSSLQHLTENLMLTLRELLS